MIDGFNSLFLYYSRRAEQEQVAAINAVAPAAAEAHRRLSVLLMVKAVLAGVDVLFTERTPPVASTSMRQG